MNYKEEMASKDAKDWIAEIKNEKDRFAKYKAVTPVPPSSIPRESKIMTSTWAMEKKTSGKLRGRLNARG